MQFDTRVHGAILEQVADHIARLSQVKAWLFMKHLCVDMKNCSPDALYQLGNRLILQIHLSIHRDYQRVMS